MYIVHKLHNMYIGYPTAAHLITTKHTCTRCTIGICAHNAVWMYPKYVWIWFFWFKVTPFKSQTARRNEYDNSRVFMSIQWLDIGIQSTKWDAYDVYTNCLRTSLFEIMNSWISVWAPTRESTRHSYEYICIHSTYFFLNKF